MGRGYPEPVTDPDGAGGTGASAGGNGQGAGGETGASFEACASSDHVLHLRGTPDDWIHPGELTTDAGFSFVAPLPGVLLVEVVPPGADFTEHWSILLDSGASANALLPGLYEDAERYPFNGANEVGLDVSGDARGCNQLTGWFELRRMEWIGSDVSAFEIRFEQVCDTRGLLEGCARFVRPEPRFGNAAWSQSFGDGLDQRAIALAIDASGNLAVASELEGEVNFGTGLLRGGTDTDLAIASFDPQGRVRWARRLGDAANQRPTSIAASPDGDWWVGGALRGEVAGASGPVTSDAAGDGLLLRWRSDGELIGERLFAGPREETVERVVSLLDGGVLVAGAFETTVDAGGGAIASRAQGSRDVFLVKLDSAGDVAWQRALGFGPGETRLGALAAAQDGGIVAAGAFVGAIDLGAGELRSAAPTNLGDAFLARLEPDGTPAFALGLGAEGGASITALAVAPNGDIVVGGTFAGELRLGDELLEARDGRKDLTALFFALFDRLGHVQWARSIPPGYLASSDVTGLAFEADGAIVATGGFTGYFHFDRAHSLAAMNDSRDVWIGTISREGVVAGSVRYGGAGVAGSAGLSLTAEGDAIVIGSFEGGLEPGGNPLVSAGGSDIFLADVPRRR